MRIPEHLQTDTSPGQSNGTRNRNGLSVPLSELPNDKSLPSLLLNNTTPASQTSKALLQTVFLLNIQGMDPAIKNQKWKIKAIADHIHLSKKTIPFFALTETHLKSRHFDAEVNINGYNIFRADRIKRHQGGSALYVNKSLAVTKSLSHSNFFCETAGIFIQPLNLVVFSVYCPPAATQAYFEESISMMQDFINQLDSPEVLVLGDFNFPFVSWEPIIAVNQDKRSGLGSNWRAVEISKFISFKSEIFLLIIKKSVLSFWNSKNEYKFFFQIFEISGFLQNVEMLTSIYESHLINMLGPGN